MSALQAAEVEHLRGQVAFDQRRVGDAARRLVGAARRLEPLDPALARTTHLEAVGAAIWAGHLCSSIAMVEVAEAARAAPPCARPAWRGGRPARRARDRLTAGYAAAVPALGGAGAVLALEVPAGDLGHWLWLSGARAAGLVAIELWDADAWHELASRQVRVARETGAVVQLQFALNFFAGASWLAGRSDRGRGLIEEERAIAQATGSSAVGYERCCSRRGAARSRRRPS